MTPRVLDALVVLGVLAAVGVSGLLLGREFFPERFGAAGSAPAPTRRITDPGLRQQLAGTAFRSAASLARPAMTIVEFADFQCPACRGVEPALRQVLREEQGRVALAYHHYPLEAIHPHAFDAAVAFECASEQGRGEVMHDLLFAAQDSIPGADWHRFASRAGLPDLARFGACMAGTAAPARVRADAAMARSLGLAGTPTLFVGETEVFGAVSADSLRTLVRKATSR
ncbi:MAG: disulfide bond formation protein DsbA [Gemmatimonadetes bacterium]|nr:disulfide bond formation protein DsbA [Gemmatimonadota bacterium]